MHYHRTVRPSMEPPFLAPGFSASFGREHQVVLRRVGRLRRQPCAAEGVGDGPPDQVSAARGELWRAQSRNRREHHLICRLPDPVSSTGDGQWQVERLSGIDPPLTAPVTGRCLPA